MAKILVDEPVKDGVLGFDRYAKALVNTIVVSSPQFVIGVLGGWGVGKTTLMLMIYESLRDRHDVVPVWFNAWRYEREKYSAIIPLLNTLLIEISQRDELRSLKEVLVKVCRCVAKGIRLQLSSIELDVSQMIKEAKDLARISGSGTIYYDDLKYIEQAIEDVNKKRRERGKSDIRFVVFIDDLDRCSPDKVLEVLESVKIFLGIKGFIYVLGLSPEVIGKCIAQKYKEMEIDGKDYVRKIIQIPFRVPEWREEDISEYLSHLLDQLDDEYRRIFDDLKELVVKGVEKNPREVKRFINSYVATREVFGLDPGILMLLQIFQFNWMDFYNRIFAYGDFRQAIVRKFVEGVSNEDVHPSSVHSGYLATMEQKDRILTEFLMNTKVKEILKKLGELDFASLNKYRRAGKAVAREVVEPTLFGTDRVSYRVRNIDRIVYDYIADHSGVISWTQAAKDLKISVEELQAATERLKKSGKLA